MNFFHVLEFFSFVFFLLLNSLTLLHWHCVNLGANSKQNKLKIISFLFGITHSATINMFWKVELYVIGFVTQNIVVNPNFTDTNLINKKNLSLVSQFINGLLLIISALQSIILATLRPSTYTTSKLEYKILLSRTTFET